MKNAMNKMINLMVFGIVITPIMAMENIETDAKKELNILLRSIHSLTPKQDGKVISGPLYCLSNVDISGLKIEDISTKNISGRILVMKKVQANDSQFGDILLYNAEIEDCDFSHSSFGKVIFNKSVANNVYFGHCKIGSTFIIDRSDFMDLCLTNSFISSLKIESSSLKISDLNYWPKKYRWKGLEINEHTILNSTVYIQDSSSEMRKVSIKDSKIHSRNLDFAKGSQLINTQLDGSAIAQGEPTEKWLHMIYAPTSPKGATFVNCTLKNYFDIEKEVHTFQSCVFQNN